MCKFYLRLILSAFFLFLVSAALGFLFFSYEEQKNVSLKQGLSPKKNIQEEILPSQVAERPTVTLLFTGDIIPARSVNRVMVGKNDFLYPFAKTADLLKNADLTVVNLESPLIEKCPVTDEGMIFCGDIKFVSGLKFAGVDIANLANNHSSNYGLEGIVNTENILRENNIATVGTGGILYQDIRGMKFAFLAYNGVSPFVAYIANIDFDLIKKQIDQARKNADYIVVLYHWGKEYAESPIEDPAIAPFNPFELAHYSIDSGADLVVGNHPHTVWGYEFYEGKPIFYALGNFIFDQMWSEETKLGIVLKLELQKGNFKNYSVHPIKIENYSQPYLLAGKEKERVLEKFVNYSP